MVHIEITLNYHLHLILKHFKKCFEYSIVLNKYKLENEQKYVFINNIAAVDIFHILKEGHK